MPLAKGESKKTISKNISEVVRNYDATGKIGTSRPASRKKAIKQAVAIAYATARKPSKRRTKKR